jgi:hypothetical protein
MNTITEDVLSHLDQDIVSHGLLAQCVKQHKEGDEPLDSRLAGVLEELLTSGKVEIGVARLKGPKYVEFIGWRGTVCERVARASQAVKRTSGPDREFAYWLCLREHVDRFEDQECETT